MADAAKTQDMLNIFLWKFTSQKIATILQGRVKKKKKVKEAGFQSERKCKSKHLCYVSDRPPSVRSPLCGETEGFLPRLLVRLNINPLGGATCYKPHKWGPAGRPGSRHAGACAASHRGS